MVIEHAERSAYYRLAIIMWIPRQANTWSNVVVVTGNSLRDPQCVLCRSSQWSRRREGRGQFDVITDAVVERQIPCQPPRILPEARECRVLKLVVRVSNTLDEILWQPRSVCLDRAERWRARCNIQIAEVVDASEVDREIG
jgi:hypothetical protein